MKSPTHVIRSVIVAALFVPASHAIIIDGMNYVSSGPPETLTAVFANPTGGMTTNLYNGYVLVQVSGSGHSRGTQLNDAFYVYTPGPSPYHDPTYYQLTFGTSPLVPLNFIQLARHRVVYDVAVGLETGVDYVPSYNSAHAYSIVLDTELLAAGRLYFGVSDGNFNDNGGAFNISVTQLAPDQSVPEEGTTALLLGCGVLGLICCSRFSRRGSLGLTQLRSKQEGRSFPMLGDTFLRVLPRRIP